MSCGEEHCITCGDVAVEMTVIELDADEMLALCVSDDGGRETVDVALLAPVRPADRVLVHAGTAIARPIPTQPTPSHR
jgi:hydrogenase expression/formation protein HypC